MSSKLLDTTLIFAAFCTLYTLYTRFTLSTQTFLTLDAGNGHCCHLKQAEEEQSTSDSEEEHDNRATYSPLPPDHQERRLFSHQNQGYYPPLPSLPTARPIGNPAEISRDIFEEQTENDFTPLDGIDPNENPPLQQRNRQYSSGKEFPSKRKSTHSSRKQKKSKSKRHQNRGQDENHCPENDEHRFRNLHRQRHISRNEAHSFRQKDLNPSPTMAKSDKTKLKEKADEIAILKDQIAKQQQQLVALKNNPPPSAKPTVVLAHAYQPADYELKEVDSGAKWLYRNIKFVYDQKTADAATLKVAKHLNKKFDDEDPSKQASWIATFKAKVLEVLSGQRNYTQTRLKDAAYAWVPGTPPCLPPPDLILKCALRQVDLDDDEERDVFFWYWEKLIPAAVGCYNWSDKVKYYKIISAAKCKKNPSEKVVTTASEAFIVLLWENCYEKWVAVRMEYHNNPEWKMPKRTKEDKNKPYFKTLYSKQDGGRQDFGGWTSAGHKRFHEIQDLIKEAKEDDSFVQLEKDALKKLKVARQIDTDVPQPPKKKKRKAPVVSEYDLLSDEDFE